MATLRPGNFGNYYGSKYDESEALTTDEMKINALYLYKALNSYGWTLNAIAGILGNMQAESSINPGRWQSDSVGWTSGGYGLVQWTPTTKYIDWCTSQGYSDPSRMDYNISRLIYEVENAIQWYATDSYDFSFKQFTVSTKDCGTLAKAFLLNYERPADQSESVQNYRSSLANNWYSYLSGSTLPDVPEPEPGTSTTTTTKRRRYNFLVLNANKRRKQWTKRQF